MCPGGTQSNGLTCSACPIGTFRPAGAADDCISCGAGNTTRFTGSISFGYCVGEQHKHCPFDKTNKSDSSTFNFFCEDICICGNF